MTASFADNEIWHVLIETDDMKRMNVEQLDDAFRLSLVDASTLVWKAGMKTWQRLGAVAGIDDEPPSLAPPAPPPPRPAPRAITASHARPAPHALAFQQQQLAQPQHWQQQQLAQQRAQEQQRQQQLAQEQQRQQQLAQQRAQEQQRQQQLAQQQAAYQQAYQQHLEQQRAHQEQAAYHARQAQAYQAQLTQTLTTRNALTQTVPATRAFAATQRAVATPPPADPFTLPKRRAALVSDVDFRRRSRGGISWGRWSLALLLLAVGVLGAYRQNLLRGGARLIGSEGRYLAAEQRTSAYLTEKAPYGVRNALTNLKLLPGPNAELMAPPVVKARPPAAPAEVAVAVAPPATEASGASSVQTVALDSLPTLAAGQAAAQAAAPAEEAPTAPKARAASTPAVSERRLASAERRAPSPRTHRAEPVAKAEKPKPEKPKAEPKRRAEPAPPANESFLNAAIRSAIASDKSGKKK